jgi:hypothetical protein
MSLSTGLSAPSRHGAFTLIFNEHYREPSFALADVLRLAFDPALVGPAAGWCRVWHPRRTFLAREAV